MFKKKLLFFCVIIFTFILEAQWTEVRKISNETNYEITIGILSPTLGEIFHPLLIKPNEIFNSYPIKLFIDKLDNQNRHVIANLDNNITINSEYQCLVIFKSNYLPYTITKEFIEKYHIKNFVPRKNIAVEISIYKTNNKPNIKVEKIQDL